MVPRPSDKLKERMGYVRYKIAVMSGKGGVGKTTVSVNLARALADSGARVGLLDVDVHGPNVPKMLGLDEERFAAVKSSDRDSAGDGTSTRASSNGGSSEGGTASRAGSPPAGSPGGGNERTEISPIAAGPNLVVASVGFVGYGKESALIWRGPMKLGVIKQFLEDIDWGELDYLVIDTPPGTGDEVMTVCQYLPDLDGAVVVTTPQQVALLDSRRTVDFAARMRAPVLGIVENMRDAPNGPAMFGAGGGERVAADLGIPFLGAVPLDSRVASSGDAGTPVVEISPHEGAGAALHAVANAIRLAMVHLHD